MKNITIRQARESDIPVIENLLLDTVNWLNGIGQPLWGADEVKWNALSKKYQIYKFSRGCCGDACDLLAQFLLKNGIRTHYVCGTFYKGTFENHQSHAWLLVENQIVLDITGDQFRDNPLFLNYDQSVYVGIEDDFHRLFEVEYRDIHENFGFDYLFDYLGDVSVKTKCFELKDC